MEPLPDDPATPGAADAAHLLEQHLALIQQYLDDGIPADRAVLEGDIQAMPAFVALENKLHPDLHLFIAPSPSALLKKINSLPPVFHLRCVLRSAVDAEHGRHHFYADIDRKADGLLSLLIVEPADLRDNVNGLAILLQLFILMLADASFTYRRISCFSTAVQKSGSDCLLFCVDFALKAYRHAAQFDALHAIHQSGRAIGNDAGDPVIERNNQDNLIVAPARLLPFAFFEHAQSATALRSIWGDDPCAVEKIREITTKRTAGAGKQKYVPSSIEYCRRQFLLQALRYSKQSAEN
jgi:YopJ family protease